MKTLLLTLSLAAAGVSTATAQVYQPNVVNGSLLGGIAGALIGGHNHDRWGEGALIGAVAGGLIGSAVQPASPVVYQTQPVAVVQSVPTATVVQQAPVVANAPTVSAAPAPQVVYVQQPQATQVVYVPYYPNAPVAYYGYPAPAVSVNVGYRWGPSRVVYTRGYRHW
jgi:hypothetical protein